MTSMAVKLWLRFSILFFIFQIANLGKLNLDQKIGRIKVACIVGRNVTIKLKHNVILSNIWRVWTYNDRVSNSSVDLVTLDESNAKYILSNETNLTSSYQFNLTVKNSTMTHRINIRTFEPSNGAKELKFQTLLINKSENYRDENIVYETIALNKYSDCSIELPVNKSLPYDVPDFSNSVRVKKNQKITLYCSILVNVLNSNNANNTDYPNFSWWMEKQNRLSNSSFSEQTMHYFKLDSMNYNHLFWSKIEYTAPESDLEAWKQTNEPISCHIGHNYYFDGSITKVSDDKSISYSVPKYSNKIPNLNCKFQLNIRFEPFIHPNVSQQQTFNESDGPILIECPIKVNFNLQEKYFMVWSIWSNKNQTWYTKLKQEYVASADFYFIESPRLDYYNNLILIKCEMFETDKYHYHPPDYKKHIYEFNQEKKYKKLLESIVHVKILPATNMWAESVISPIEVCSTNLKIMIVLFVVFIIVMFIMFLVIIFSKIKSKKRHKSYQFKLIKSRDENESNEFMKIANLIPLSAIAKVYLLFDAYYVVFIKS